MIVVYDDNRITIDGPTTLSFDEDVAQRFEAYGWFVQSIGGDGNDMDAFRRALDAARAEPLRPSMIRLRTHIGYGSPHKQDSAEAHGSPLGEEEVALTKKCYGWDPQKTFFVPDAAREHFQEQKEKGLIREREWNGLFDRYAARYPAEAGEFRRAAARELPAEWQKIWLDGSRFSTPQFRLQRGKPRGKFLTRSCRNFHWSSAGLPT